MRMPWLIRAHGDVQRWLMPSILHFSFSHIVINVILQLALGTVLESVMGALRMCVFYAIVVFGSNLFGGCLSSMYALGSDPVVYGFLGGLFTLLMVYWHRIGGTTCTKVCTIFMVVVVFVIATLLMTQSAQTSSKYTQVVSIMYPDLYGCIGGFLYGFLSSMFLLPREFKREGKIVWRDAIIYIVGLGSVSILSGILLVVFFAGKEPA
jgi:membrane associated rhomboid family serine protease